MDIRICVVLIVMSMSGVTTNFTVKSARAGYTVLPYKVALRSDWELWQAISRVRGCRKLLDKHGDEVALMMFQEAYKKLAVAYSKHFENVQRLRTYWLGEGREEGAVILDMEGFEQHLWEAGIC